MKTRKLVGQVIPGVNVAHKSLAPLFEEILRRTGLKHLVPGTLNVKLPHWYPGHLDIILLAHEYEHHEHLFIERCRVFGKDALIIRTSTNHHGPAMLEIMAQEHLRSTHSLTDYCKIEVEVFERGPKRAIERSTS
jgi:CTP-dependent riboflavin kinase